MLPLPLPQQKKRTMRMIIIQQQLNPPNPQLQFIKNSPLIKLFCGLISYDMYSLEGFAMFSLCLAFIVHIMPQRRFGAKIYHDFLEVLPVIIYAVGVG